MITGTPVAETQALSPSTMAARIAYVFAGSIRDVGYVSEKAIGCWPGVEITSLATTATDGPLPSSRSATTAFAPPESFAGSR